MAHASPDSAPAAIGPVAPTPITEAQCRPAFAAPRTRGPIRDEAELSGLVGDIYDAAMDSGLWPGTLRKIGDFTGGMAICLHTWDAAERRWYACGRTDPDYDRLFLDQYYKINPLAGRFNRAELGRLVGIGDVMDVKEYRASDFYWEWSRPQGLADIKMLWLDRSATTNAILVAYRYERNPLSDEEIGRRACLIGQHLRRAAGVGRALEQKTVETASLADALDGLRDAVLLVDAEARVVHANAAGAAMLRGGPVMRTAASRLVATDRHASPALLKAIAAAKGGDLALGGHGAAVVLEDCDGERYLAHVLPLNAAERRGLGGRRAVAALVVRKAALDLGRGALGRTLAATFGLTPTELRVLLAIVETGGVSEAAEALGVGQATVKTHLHRLFGKTDTRRQADLVKLVAAFASPLAD